MKRLRSILSRVVLVLLLGLGTSVAVAWLLAAFLPHRHLEYRRNVVGDPKQYIAIVEFSRTGMVRRSWNAGLSSSSSLWADLSPHAAIRLRNRTVNQDRSWGALPADLAHPAPNAGGAEDARGWPFLCLWCSLEQGVIEGSGRGHPVRGGIPISRLRATSRMSSFRALPLTPIWHGLAANSAIYATAWAVAIPTFRLVRGLIRHRRGLCPRCAYNLNRALGAGCPECGWNCDSLAAN